MAENVTDGQLASWQITTTTVYCDRINSYVTVLVRKDWTSKCTERERHGQSNVDNSKQTVGRFEDVNVCCSEAECAVVMGYRERLIREDSLARVKEESVTT